LIDELREASGVHRGDKLCAEINPIADVLHGNLDEVVQYGKRADAIVNMLLHLRKGSGEHRPVDNELVEAIELHDGEVCMCRSSSCEAERQHANCDSKSSSAARQSR
jgi:hypothetical protein